MLSCVIPFYVEANWWLLFNLYDYLKEKVETQSSWVMDAEKPCTSNRSSIRDRKMALQQDVGVSFTEYLLCFFLVLCKKLLLKV